LRDRNNQGPGAGDDEAVPLQRGRSVIEFEAAATLAVQTVAYEQLNRANRAR
jgi:hypothetical protein